MTYMTQRLIFDTQRTR